MSNVINLTVEMGTLPPLAEGANRQQYADAIAAALLVYLPSTDATFKIGGSAPTSDEGPWFKEITDPKSGDSGYELWVWSSTAAAYVPLTLNQIQLRYFVGSSTPSQNVYDVWFKTDGNGKPLGIHTYNGNTSAWEPNSYTPDEIDALFEPTVAGKKQILWDNVLNKPANSTLPRALSTVPAPLYDWEQVYHTVLGTMIIYDPLSGQWKTLDGGVGDLKEVTTTTNILGNLDDFANGIFTSVRGANPGWDIDFNSQGRAVVGANDTEVWDVTTPSVKSAGSSYGNDDYVMTIGQMPAHIHPMNRSLADNYSSSSGDNLEGAPGSERGPVDTGIAGGSDPISKVQKSIAYYRLKKII